ncbi:hypothetical protein [uncultured Algibacter sp.]|uniref:hypothetical protein n=1 Tax=uncultured Algibacter sp. TaxID=298659 RepID=UPI00261516C0|nr:hypothetical protein [uncultured Algibacter sp.]
MFEFVKKTSFYIVFLFCFLNMTCDDEDIDMDKSGCGYEVVVDKNEYDGLLSDHFNFVDAEIVGDCLFLKIAASGCTGDTWGFRLVDSEAVAESLPEQRFLKFQLNNEELCLAVFEKTISFDLRVLQIHESGELLLNIDGLEDSLSYKY